MIKLKRESLDWSLAHIRRFGDTDVFPMPFEYDAISHQWETMREFLADQDLLNWQSRPHRILLAPKGRYAFRLVTQLDPLDCLLFTALIHEVGGELEGSRVPIVGNRVFSYRFQPDRSGQLYDPTVGHKQFAEMSLSKAAAADKHARIAIADVADFYPRVYHHRMENALLASTKMANHVKAIIELLKGWNATESIGIPVGSAATHLLAEITVGDVDQMLLAYEIDFIRYIDDYRMFCGSQQEAYKALVVLAETLHRNHSLTLQPQKTRILTGEEFLAEFGQQAHVAEAESLRRHFYELLAKLGIEDPYQLLAYEHLDPDTQKALDQLNLVEVLKELVAAGPAADLASMRFVLAQLGQREIADAADVVLSNMEVLYPIMPDVNRYLIAVAETCGGRAGTIGGQLVGLLEHPVVGALPFLRLQIANVLAQSTRWEANDKLLQVLRTAPDDETRRECALALRLRSQSGWFQSQWRTLENFAPWMRRAVLAGVSTLAKDARRHYVRAWLPKLDPLERAVAKWAQETELERAG